LAADRRSAYLDALHLLAGRELTVAECRARLLARDHPGDEIDAAVAHLLETGALDDARAARAYAQTAVRVKGRGRLRVQRELQAKGIARETAGEILGEVFGDLDERRLVADAIRKRLRGRTRVADRAEAARLYQHLVRQGFSPGIAIAVLRKAGAAPDSGADD
jgi:regulatory protein